MQIQAVYLPKIFCKTKRGYVSQIDFDKSHFLASPETVLVKTNLERIVGFVSKLCQSSFAAINTTSENRNIVRASIGLDDADPDFIQAVCDYSLQIKRYSDTNMVASRGKKAPPAILNGIEFYAGAVLRRTNGTPFGTLFIWDFKENILTDLQRDALKLCAQHASQHIELSRLLSKSRNRNELLTPEAPRENVKNYWRNFKELTPRETQVLHAILDNTGDSSNKRIAQILSISPRTVELHRARVFTKMHVRSAAELVALSLKA